LVFEQVAAEADKNKLPAERHELLGSTARFERFCTRSQRKNCENIGASHD
jgi:hypothetical protein